MTAPHIVQVIVLVPFGVWGILGCAVELHRLWRKEWNP